MKLGRTVAVWLTVTALCFMGGCATSALPSSLRAQQTALHEGVTLPDGWSVQKLPGVTPGNHLSLLQRAPRSAPLRFRVFVIPGSGCTGFAPFADRYFAGLLHAQVQVLHKPGVDLQAGPAPQHCAKGFIEADSLSAWRDDALAALGFLFGSDGTSPDESEKHQLLPTILVGISEGGELLPSLAAVVPGVVGLVLLSSSGLDPSEAAYLQAKRLGELDAWHRLVDAAASPLPDTLMTEGRTLRYWRDLRRWALEWPLMESSVPLLQVWGDSDELVPVAAYASFARRARSRQAPFCSWRFPGADHGLHGTDGADGLQRVWARLEAWGRHFSTAEQRQVGVLRDNTFDDFLLCADEADHHP